ncbi:MAG: FecR domain-containing protein [Saprospiraceae bacterium]|nr:FecR domain-containing protein [Saprospiraceae bacterium]
MHPPIWNIEMKMDDAIYMELIAKYLSGNIAAAERERLMAWAESDSANRSFFEQTIQLWSISSGYEVKYETNTPKAWDALEARLFGDDIATIPIATASSEKPSAKIMRLSINKVILRIAAVILAAVAISIWQFGYFSKNQDQTVAIETKAQERKTIELPDGSTVWLNESTRLSYEQDFTERIVHLEGEAFFDVTKKEGKSFTILSGEASTTVLGTSFNVRAYPKEDQIEVTVATGKVALKNIETTKEVQLVAGQSGVLEKPTEEVRIEAEVNLNADAWKTQELKFDDAPMSEVIQAAERFYGVKIIADDNLLNCPLTSTTGSDFNDFIKTLNFMNSFKVEQRDSVYIISGKGCN